MSFKSWSLIGLLAINLLSCGKAKTEAPAQEAATLKSSVFVKGDPRNILKGSQRQPTSPVFTNQLFWYQGLKLFSVFTFNELGRSRSRLLDEKDAGQSDLFYFVKKGEKKWIYQSTSGTWSLVFEEDENGRLNLKGVLGRNKKLLKSNAIHYSFKTSGGAFSVALELDFAGSLGKVKNRSEKVMAFLTFVKRDRVEEDSILHYLNRAYQYLFGAGKGVRWDPLYQHTINICDEDPKDRETLKGYLEEALKPWNEVLGGSPKIVVGTPETFSPMGDLNQNCVYLVDSYSRTARRYSYANPGTAYVVGKMKSGDLLDGDIILWRDEFEKYGQHFFDPELKPYVIKTLKHELGHWLGLAHQFDPKTPSIMGYGYENELTDYDKQAVLELYSF